MKYLFIAPTLIFISKVGLTKDINKQIERNFRNPEIIIKSLENYEKKFLINTKKKNNFTKVVKLQL